MAIGTEHEVLVVVVLVLAPGVSARIEFSWDNNCLKYLKKHQAEINRYYKRERLSVRSTEIWTCSTGFNIGMKELGKKEVTRKVAIC